MSNHTPSSLWSKLRHNNKPKPVPLDVSNRKTATSEQWLSCAIAPYQRTIRQAWLWDKLALGCLIGQMYCLSTLFAVLLSEHLPSEHLLPVYTIARLDGQPMWLLPCVLFCWVVRFVCLSIKDDRLATAGVALAAEQRRLLWQALGQLGMVRTQIGADGAIASYITKAPDEMMGYLRFCAQKMSAVSTPLLLAGVIAFYNLNASLLLLLTAPLVPIFMIFIGASTSKKSHEQMHALAQLGGRFLDWLRGMGTLVRIRAITIARDDIAKSAEQYRMRTMSVLKIAFLNSAVLEFLSALAIALVAVYLGFGLMGILPWSLGKVVVDYHSALFILLLVPEFYAPLRRLGMDYHAKGQALAASRVLAPFFVPTQHQPIDTVQVSHFDICLDKVRVFSHNGRSRLPPVCLNIAQGEMVCVMGESGAGKSTLLAVLLGFCDYQGVASIGGYGLMDWNKTQLRRHIGFLPQSPALLPISIADNLRLANPNACDDSLYQALAQVGLSDFVTALPDGINTLLGERGGGLSGGQAQRLALAQLLLQQADIWLLDEPSEHLDKSSKAALHQLIANLHRTQGKTIIWVSHEPIAWADKCYQIQACQHEVSDGL